MKKAILLFCVLVLLTMQTQAQTVTDYDGNVYTTVTIGTQIWLGENLKVTHYRDGTAIPNVTDNTAWGNLSSGAYCNVNNTPSNGTIYGRLYNGYAVFDSHNLCPAGWHVPTNEEWTTLINYLGGQTFAGGKLKETGTTHWGSPNTGATNESGFTALPAGYREESSGTFTWFTGLGYHWTSTIYNIYYLWCWVMFYNNATALNFDNYSLQDGLSVRCIKDAGAQINEINDNIRIEIYPNPANENITIETTDITKQQTISIYNMQGQLLIQQPIQQPKTEIDISHLAKGLYVIKLSNSDGIAVKKFIKE